MFNILFSGQESLLVLLSAFIIGGIFKTRGVFLPVFTMLTVRVKSRRISLLLISLISGVLPVEGRVSVSAPILDSVIAHNNHCGHDHSRGKIGVLDFIATHHYYLWSPLEKSIIMIMAGLSMSYAQVLSYTAIPLAMYLIFLIGVVFFYVDEDDTELEPNTSTQSWVALAKVVPFLAGLVLSIFYPPYIVFPIITVFYILTNAVSFKELWTYIRWDSLAVVAFVIVAANLVKSNSAMILHAFTATAFAGPPTLSAVILAVIGGGIASFIMGSSSKYAGICVALTLVFGIQYFPLILMVEYAGYLLSPTHKCLAISASYFNTKLTEFYKYVGCLAILMVVIGIAQVV